MDGVGDIFIRYSTDKGETWLDDWPRNPLTTDGDIHYDNWPEIDWGRWSPEHLDVAWIARSAELAYDVHYADAAVFKNPFVRGDARADGDVDMFDAMRILFWQGGQAAAPPCLNAGDADDDEDVDMFDALRILHWMGGVAEPGLTLALKP